MAAKPSAAPKARRAYTLPGPGGTWRAWFTDAGLCALEFPPHPPPRHGPPAPAKTRAAGPCRDAPALRGQEGAVGRRVRAVLARRARGAKADLPWSCFDLRGATPFQRRAWRALCAVPHGETRTYGELAAAAGRPRAARAAGNACGGNPVPLLIPCHRITARGGLGGFGPGPEWKRFLLRLEGAL